MAQVVSTRVPVKQPTNRPSGLINTIPEVKGEDFQKWLNDVYDLAQLSDESINSMYEQFSYQGFNRDDVLKQLYTFVKDKSVVYQLIMVGALRGPQASAQIKLMNGQTPLSMGIPASGAQGTKILTMNKIVSATADIAAHLLKKSNAPKRLNVELPGWLQFPSAGSIKLPSNLRNQHVEFSRKFSEVIGGKFNEGIYNQMEANAYLDPKIKLF
jgi:hypothetical protein